MDQKLIFLDIDGTLTMPGANTPPESALKAVQAARKKGHLVFLCTGRSLAMASPMLALGFDGIICSAGGYVECGNKVLYDHPMTKEQTERVLKYLGKCRAYRILETKDATYGDEGVGDFLKTGNPDANSEMQRWAKTIQEDMGLLPISDYDGRPAYKVVFMCGKMEQLKEAKAALSGEFSFRIQNTFAKYAVNGELINRAFSKGTGIERICGHLGVTVENTIGFGDSMNDREMVETVGVSVCMENGSEELKALCDRLCPPAERDGLAEGFKELGLI